MEFSVLGPIEVYDGERPIEVRPRMPRAVLALLLMDANRVVSLDRLIDQLWGEEPPASATTALQGYVSQLRRLLEPDRPSRTPPRVLVTQPPGYVLRIGPEAVDAARFEALAARGREMAAERPGEARQLLRRALAMWRGTPYAEFAFEDFAQPEVARLTELRFGVEETLAELELAVGDHATAIADLERLVTNQPLREGRWELLALALYRCGRQAEALRALNDARRTLTEELGLEPGLALRQLEQAILEQSPSLDWTPITPQPAATVAVASPPIETVDQPVPPIDDPLDTSGRRAIVGRQGELGVLQSALDSAITGGGRIALVSGEPGIGKTRLVEELADRATASDVQVAWGRCQEGELAPPYWPWIEIIRALAAEAEPEVVRSALGTGAADLAQIVPEVKELLDGDVEALPLLEPEAARARLYNAIVGGVLRLARERPLLLVVDDLHWADPPSTQILRLLAGPLANAPILLVCTYRDTDARAVDPILSTVASLGRAPDVVRVHLGGLSEDDVASLVAAATGTQPAPDVARAIRGRTEGNPFFVSELARLLGAEHHLDDAEAVVRRRIPAGVRDVIRTRLARLPDDAVALLGVAAVIGTEFDLDVLTAVADLEEERTLELVEAMLLTGVVVESSTEVGTYRFSHGLVRETVYDGLSSLRRPRLHRRVAAVLERLGDDDDGRVLQIAQHLYAASQAGGAEEAFDWAVRAADRATSHLAFEQAEEILSRAIELLARMRPGPDVTRRELAAQVQLGALRFMTRGYSEAAVGEAWSRARQLCREVPGAPELLPTLWGLWAFTCVRAEFDAAGDVADELLEHGRRTEDTLFRVIGHETTGITRWHRGRLAEASDHLQQGAALCDSLPDELFTGVLLEKHPGVACRSFGAVVQWLRGEEATAVALADEAVALARRLAHPFSVVFALFFDAWVRVMVGDRDAVVRRADEALSLARHHGFRQYVAMVGVLQGWATDDVSEIEASFEDFLATGSRMLQHFFLGLLAQTQWRTGQVGDALTAVERALAEGEASGERFWEAELHRLRAELAKTAGPPGDAEESLARALTVARAQGARALERRVVETLTNID